MEKATLAAGCFWHVEEAYREIKGVIYTQVGYTGGKNPDYKQVCTDKSGHAEALEITFDPEVISYEQLLDVFWSIHDPTQLNRQGPDIGRNYRSAIFYHNEEQHRIAEESKKKQKNDHIVTEIAAAGPFYRAEEYHQQYLAKRGLKTC